VINLTDWANVATIVTGASALTAVIVWGQKQWNEQKQRRATTRRRTWNDGYIPMEEVSSWYVRLAKDDAGSTARIVLEVVDSNGNDLDEQMAYTLRLFVQRDGMLSQVPTPEQFAFLKELQKARRARPGALPVRR